MSRIEEPPSAIVKWPRCWCGEERAFATFGPDYLRCAVCGTLVSKTPAPSGSNGVDRDAEDFYGESYPEEHQRALGYPGIEERRRSDLRERCCYWLETLLRYRRPPGRLLELGCAHGAATKLFAAAGFAAVGIEMSPSVVADAARLFEIDARVGPIENLPALGTFDAIVSFDVIEHLPDPLRTLRLLRRHLACDGLLLVQTPLAPPAPYASLVAAGDPFLSQLKPGEHVYLYTADSVARLLRETGFTAIAHERPLFPYDMFFVAGDVIGERIASDPQAGLDSTSEARVVRALLDTYASQRMFEEAAAARLDVIGALQQACDERLALIEQLDRALKAAAVPVVS